MAAAKTTWGIGDYPAMAERLKPVAEQAAELAQVQPGSRVVDVGCGTGTFARAAAARGGRVIGLDGEPALLEVARSLGDDGVRWRESDFAALDADDQAFDVVASLFGVMYAADHRAAARELARVCAPEGVVVLAAWTPASFMPAFGRAVGRFLPPPPASSMPPGAWGDRRTLTAALAEAGLAPDFAETGVLRLSFDDADQATGFLIRTAGHVLAERERLLRCGRWDSLQAAAQAVVEQHATPSAAGAVLPLEYLLARYRARHVDG